MSATTVAAIVVTYNRLELLKKTIEALRAQTRKPDAIFVINNSSTDGTTDWLAEQKDITAIYQANTGSSGGQFAGFKAAYEAGYEWIWTMDDDVAPRENCLETLLSTNLEPAIIRAPWRKSASNEYYFNDTLQFNLTNPFKSLWVKIISQRELKHEVVPAEGITFEGPLIHRSIVSRIGFPEKKFFIYGDDSEYFIRAKKAGATCVVMREAKMRRMLNPADDLPITPKHFYIIRNLIAIDALHGSILVRILRPFLYMGVWLTRARNLKQAKIVIKAFACGYFFRRSKDLMP
ncbi:MAG: glycosyltransferase [Chloroflexota bacterium]